jgi:hypothetical protein
MRRIRSLVATVLLVAPAACTFPDVDYAAGGAGTGGNADAGCTGLDSCTGTAMSCAGGAQATHTACVAPCKNATCTMKCDMDLATTLALCSQTCSTCAGPSCASAPAACSSAAGL